MKLVMYGAGSVGRGFIWPLFASSGWDVVFIDVDLRIIEALNQRHGYHYTVVADPSREVCVTGVCGVNGQDEEAVVAEIADCDLLATALGASALERVAPIIARGLERRLGSGTALNILICENLKDAAARLRDWLAAALPEALSDASCGLVEAAIGRMIPVAVPDPNDPLHIAVEEYGFLSIDKEAYIGEVPEVTGLIAVSPFEFYEQRKLYLHNMGHAICAYLGLLRGYETIAQAVSDPTVRLLTQSAMTESAAMLSAKYNVSFARVFDHAEDLLLRFGNVSLGDTCERVGRDPMRKLAAGDRLAGALSECWKYEVIPGYIALGFAAALRHVTADAVEAERLAVQTGGLTQEQAALVMRLYPALDGEFTALPHIVEQIKRELRGKIV